MATLVKTESGNWKALIRLHNCPACAKTFRLKSDAKVWARQIENYIRQGTYIRPTPVNALLFSQA